MSFFLDTPIGRLVNVASAGGLLPKREERSDFVLPESLAQRIRGANRKSLDDSQSDSHSNVGPPPQRGNHGLGGTSSGTQVDTSDIEKVAEAAGAVQAMEKGPTTGRIDVILVGWYGDDDVENPQNFSLPRKGLVTMCICILTFCVYGGSSIVTPGIPGVMEEFNVSLTKGTMLLSAFIMGYSIGPLLLGPPSDMPSIGRSTPYWVSMLCLTLLNVGAARSQSYGTLVVMRFLSGIAGSPALATGGATLSDVWEGLTLPKAIAMWSMGALCGPVLAPVLAGWAAMNVSWRLPLWLFTAMSGLGLLITLFLLPETLHENILHRRAARLRKLTGDKRLRSQGEISQAAMTPTVFLAKSFFRPIRISLEPIVLYSSVLLGLMYAIFYCSFESVPIIYGQLRGFNTGEMTLVFLSVGVFGVIALLLYLCYLTYWFDPRFIRKASQGIIDPEDHIILALLSAPIVMISLLWTGWTAKPSVSYWSPLIAQGIYVIPVFYLFQTVLSYLSFAYAENAQAVFTANGLIRGLIASSFPLFAHALFTDLGLGKAYTLLAGCSLALMLPLWGLFKYGFILRRYSKYAHDYSQPTV